MRDKRIEDNYKLALEVAEKHKCYFIEQVVSHLPISKKTFYEYYPVQSDELHAIKEILDNNRIDTKSKMYNKWFDSDNATLQVALMKLIGNDEESHRLNGTSMKVESTNTTTIIDLGSGKAPKEQDE